MFPFLRFKKQKQEEKFQTVEDAMVYMASIGVSPHEILRYQSISESMKNYEREHMVRSNGLC